ncbi:MAG: hypothetical protein GY813_13035 [Halieaceae bacterium]|nr:hypothetical protein [Halieaceae bacterium]
MITTTENEPSQTLVASQDRLPVVEQPMGSDQHPAAVYLARLGKGSRRTMRTALNTVAEIATGTPDATVMPWSQLRYQHTAAIRATLAERYAPSTANKHLAALRGVLREAWRLGQLDGDDYHRAVDRG